VFERFTERARQVVVLAQEEARGLNHNYIGTEHLLLGLLRDEDGLPARVLRTRAITADRARERVAAIVVPGEEGTEGQIPFTERAKKVLELSLREGLSLGHNHIGTEHILLGMLEESEGVGVRVLVELGADPAALRDEIIRMAPGPRAGSEWLPPSEGRPPQAFAAGPPHGGPPPDRAWLHGFEWVLGRIGAEIQGSLGRDPDVGDLLLLLSTVPGTVAFDALRERGVDPDALWATVERGRREQAHARDDMGRQLEAIGKAKDEAVQAGQLDRAVELRDQERELRERLSGVSISPDALDEIRRRLGIPRSGV
jgi:hypothetical protein